MAHELLGERFFGMGRREDVWHRLGNYGETPTKAYPLFKDTLGDIPVNLMSVFTRLPDGTEMELPERVLLRDPIAEDPNYVSFGVATAEDFTLLNPLQAARLWDEYCGLDVDTAMYLRAGKIQIITALLPKYAIAGDEMSSRIAFLNHQEVGVTCWGLNIDTRIVCANTMAMAHGERGGEKIRFTHTPHIQGRVGEWLSTIVARATATQQQTKEMGEFLASVRCDEDKMASYLDRVYPVPAEPNKGEVLASMYKDKFSNWEKIAVQMDDRANAVMDLFQEQRGIGQDSRACSGTMFGIVQATIELENFRRGKNRSEAVLVGTRANTIQSAWDVALDVSKN